MTEAHCHRCLCHLDVCELCERADCAHATCYQCLRTTLLPQAPDLDAAEPAPSN